MTSSWRSKLEQTILQGGLLESRPSLEGVEGMRRRPAAVYMGVGVCTRESLSAALPVDVLGMLLPAEAVRRSLEAPHLLVLVADTHAVASGFPPLEVARAARRVEDSLHAAGAALGLERLQVVRASSFHRGAAFERVLAEVQEHAPAGEHPYFLREVADIAFLHRLSGGLLKVGWTLSRKRQHNGSLRDERAFDARARAWLDDAVGYVYCRPGRALDDEHPRVAPYLAPDPTTRICLDPDEPVQAKLRQARQRVSPATLRGALAHFRALAATYSRTVAPLEGSLAVRLQSMIAAASARPGRRAVAAAPSPLLVLNPAGSSAQSSPASEPPREESKQCNVG